MNDVLRIDRMLRDAAAKSAKLAEARANLPPGSSRARVTTANAKWARAAEAREGLATRLREAVEALNDPAEIAEVLAGMLRGRGVDAVRTAEPGHRFHISTSMRGVWISDSTNDDYWPLRTPEARAAIVRIAATTTAEDAVKALEAV